MQGRKNHGSPIGSTVSRSNPFPVGRRSAKGQQSGYTGLPLDQIKQFRAYGWHAQSLEEKKASKKPIRLLHLNFSQTEIQQEEYHEIKHTRQRRRQDAPSEG